MKKITQRFSQVLNHKGLSGMYIDYAETSAKGIQDVSIVQENGPSMADRYNWLFDYIMMRIIVYDLYHDSIIPLHSTPLQSITCRYWTYSVIRKDCPPWSTANKEKTEPESLSPWFYLPVV